MKQNLPLQQQNIHFFYFSLVLEAFFEIEAKFHNQIF
jgi:hypothetical protein